MIKNEETSEVQEKVEKMGGDSITSFDELEGLHARDEEKKETKEDKEESKEVSTKKEESEESEIDKKGEIENGKEMQKSEKIAQKVEEVKNNKDSEKPKTLKLKNGDSLVDLRTDSEVQVVVNGKPEKTTLQELINNYSGKTNWSRKFTELSNDKKTLDKDKAIMKKTVDDFYDLAVVKKDPMKAVNFLGDLVGADMAKFWDDFNAQMIPHVEKLASMTEEEKRAVSAESKLEWYKQKEESEKSKRERETIEKEIEDRVAAEEKRIGIDRDTFYKTYDELRKSGKVKEDDITPELVANYYEEVTSRSGLMNLLKEISPDLEQENLMGAVEDLRAVQAKNPDLTDEDIRDIATKVWGSKASKNLSRKILKSKPVNTSRPSMERRYEPVSFDDLD